MKPATLVMPGKGRDVETKQVVYAKDQPEYIPLPALRDRDGVVLTRWKLGWRERLRALLFGDVFLAVWTFNRPLQPLWLDVKEPGWFEPVIPYERPKAVPVPPGPPNPPRPPKDKPVG